jgi:hypothetical protein
VASRRQLAFAVALGAAALLDVAVLPWAVAATALSWNLRRSFAPPGLDSEPQRQLMRSRRRNESASVVVVQADRSVEPEPLWMTLRATDGFDVARGSDGIEIRAVLEGEDLHRAAFEQRIRGTLGAAEARFGWASFPADGLTLDVLVDAARADLAAAGAPVASVGGEPAPVTQGVPAHATAIAE